MIHESPFAPIAQRRQSVGERVFETLAESPGRVVLRDARRNLALTGGEVIELSKRLAGGLGAAGFGAGTTVALMAPNSPEFCVVFHGVAWAGGTLTTLNPTYTAAEAHHQLADSQAGLLITTAALAGLARRAAQGTGVRAIVTLDPAPGHAALADLMGDALPEQAPVDLDRHVAVLPYSSGTTGLPKGVMLSHGNLVSNIDQSLGVANLRPGDISPVFLPFFHIYGMGVMMNAYLAGGGALVTMERFDLDQFLALIETHRARALRIVPPVALALARDPRVDDYDLSSLETIVAAAAPLAPEIGEEIARRLGCICAQGFGMTELSPTSHGSPKDRARPGACGLTVASTRTRIVDPDTGRDCGPGEEGEIWVQGPQVMLGYHRNPEATARTVVEGGWLRTGDLGCVDAEGYLFVRDRLKELIKVKGFQVAPAELEAVLLGHPAVRDAAVIGVPDAEAGERPKAFIVVEGQAPGLEELREFMAATLSRYKLIEAVEVVGAIPKSASGKILRRVLRG